MNKHLVLVAVGATLSLAACGDEPSGNAAITVERLSGGKADPPAAAAAGTLATVADSHAAHTRIGYLNVDQVDRLRSVIDPLRVRRLVLGEGAARVTDRSPAPRTAVQIADVTVLQGDTREVAGGSDETREPLAQTTPQPNVLEEEAISVIQSCLGDPAAETIVGPEVLGLSAAVGVSLLDSQAPPAGPKLRICAAPRYVRGLDRAQARLHRLFPSTGLTEAERPVIDGIEMGEREIVGSSIALSQVDPALLDDLLSGGPKLLAIADPGPSRGPNAEVTPHEH